MNPFDILGSVMSSGMTPSAGRRMESTFGNKGLGAPDGVFGQMMGGGQPGAAPRPPGGMNQGMPSGGIFDILGQVAGSMLGGGAQQRAPGTPGGGGSQADILKSIAGAIFGGQNNGTGPAAAGVGANSIFGTLAAQAIEMAKQTMAGGQSGHPDPTGGQFRQTGQVGGQTGQSPFSQAQRKIDIDDATAVIAGMRKPANREEERQVLDVATLTIRAMINAAKADGTIDESEAQKLLGKMQEDGVTREEREFVISEMQKPIDTDNIVRAVPNEQVAAQIYTASLMAIEIDTDAEQRYMQDLARKLGLNKYVVAYLHSAVGLS